MKYVLRALAEGAKDILLIYGIAVICLAVFFLIFIIMG
jgi:hypothetical protein